MFNSFLVYRINPPKTIFSSTPLDFDCNLELFIKGEGDTTFSRQLPSDGVIEMGNEIQLRGTVRQGDGKLKVIKSSQIFINLTYRLEICNV